MCLMLFCCAAVRLFRCFVFVSCVYFGMCVNVFACLFFVVMLVVFVCMLLVDSVCCFCSRSGCFSVVV